MITKSQVSKFIHDITNEPANSTTRLVFADYLEEHGYIDRAWAWRWLHNKYKEPIYWCPERSCDWFWPDEAWQGLRQKHSLPWQVLPWGNSSDGGTFGFNSKLIALIRVAKYITCAHKKGLI